MSGLWVAADMKAGTEGSLYDLTHMEFLGHYRPEMEEQEAVWEGLVMSLTVEDPRGSPSLIIRHTQACAYKKEERFWKMLGILLKSVCITPPSNGGWLTAPCKVFND